MTQGRRHLAGYGLSLLTLAGCAGEQSALSPASPDARLIATLAWWMFGFAGFILIVTLGLLLVGVGLRRERERGPISRRGSIALVVGCGVIAPIVAIIAVAASGVLISDETEGATGVDGALVEVRGQRWWWEFRYLDANGDTIAVTANELHLPAGKRSRLILTSDNVIHSFWAPNLQGKTDLIPGQRNILYAEPEAPGAWRGQCAEFCGLQHALMGMMIIADPPADFEDWLVRQARPATAAGPGLDVFLAARCQKCHTIRGVPAADGDEGPDLTHLASRRTLAAATLPNSRGNLGGWITSTHRIKPGALMPAFAPAPEDLRALLDFLEGLE